VIEHWFAVAPWVGRVARRGVWGNLRRVEKRRVADLLGGFFVSCGVFRLLVLVAVSYIRLFTFTSVCRPRLWAWACCLSLSVWRRLG